MAHPRILCVDDEPNVLEGLQRNLRNGFEVSVATSGAAALKLLKDEPSFEVIVSDMRMPGMSGAALLAEFRVRAPDTVRLLLTGQADLESAVAAVNEGQVFRFLTKPCPAHALIAALRSAVAQYRLVTSERVLLEQTLVGSIRALTDVLSLTHPEAFGAATRQHERARRVARKLQLSDAWHVEVASMLSLVGYVVLPGEVLAKVNSGAALDDSEREMLSRVPSVAERVLAHIPRIENVQAVLRHLQDEASSSTSSASALPPIGARILRALQALTAAEARHGDTESALAALVRDREQYDPAVLEAVLDVCRPQAREVRALTLRELRSGMVLLDDVKTNSGMLLVGAGQRVTPQLLERLFNFGKRLGLVEPIRCEVDESEN